MIPEQIEQERKEFEARLAVVWALEEFDFRRPHGNYFDEGIDFAWVGWLERARAAQLKASREKTLDELTRIESGEGK